MREIIELQQKLVPGLLDVMKKRYWILRQLMLTGTVGRRTLATSLGMTERVLRAEADELKELGLLESNAAGMTISSEGIATVESLGAVMHELLGLAGLEARLRVMYGLKQVIVVPGDSDQSKAVKQELGRAGAQELRKHMRAGDTIAVTGGTTMAQLANQMAFPPAPKGVSFVPARGGLGESVDYQANTIVSTMAKRTGAQYRLLHVPDHLSEDAYSTLMQERNIREIVDVIRGARIVVHGIGDALVMARRRKVNADQVEAMKREGALAEAFGYYFDAQGAVVHRMPTAGLRLEEIQRAEVVIAIAGGSSKAEAIAAIMRFGHDDVLVTDEAAAAAIIRRADEAAGG